MTRGHPEMGWPPVPFHTEVVQLPVSAPAGGSVQAGHGPSHVTRTPAVVVAVAAWSLAGLSLLAIPFTEPTWHVGQWFFLVDVADAVVFGAVATVLLARGRHAVAWLVALCAVGGGLAALGFQWSMVLAVHPQLPDLDPLSSAQNWGWVPGTEAMILLVPWLVRSTPLRTLERAAIGAGILLISVTMVGRLTDPFPWPDGAPTVPFPVRSEWWAGMLQDAFAWEVGALCVLSYIAAADLVRRWAGAPPERRGGLGWLAVACILMTTTFVPLALPETWVADLPVWFTPVLHLSSQLFFPAALLVAVLGQQLHGLDVAVNRATVYGLLTGGVLVVYLAVVWSLGTVLPEGQVPGLVGAAVVAAAIQPGRRVLQGRVDRLVRGDSQAPMDALARVGHGLGSATGTQGLSDAVAEAVRLSLRLGGVAIDVDWPTGARRLAQAGIVSGEVLDVPLVVQQEHVGELLVSPRRGERLDRSTITSLENLAPVVAATVQLVARTRALAESRARIAEARDEERRQLRRELHDGFGPALAGIGLGLQASRNLIDSDPDGVRQLLETLAVEVEERVEEVRSLARGLLPPVLEDLGLVPAIVELAERHRLTEGLAVHLAVDPAFGAVEPELRGALYGIVAEAVRNIVRHASASSCMIELKREDGDIVVTVTDDGIGIAPGAVPGVGLRSMQERADAVGGRFEIRAAGRGTVVQVRVPARDSGLALGSAP